MSLSRASRRAPYVVTVCVLMLSAATRDAAAQATGPWEGSFTYDDGTCSQDVGFDLVQTAGDLTGSLGSASVTAGGCATLLSIEQSTGQRFPATITGALTGTNLVINILKVRTNGGIPNQVTAGLATGTLDDGELTATGTLLGPRTWTDFDHDFLPDCDLANPAAQAECGAVSGASRAVTLVGHVTTPAAGHWGGSFDYDDGTCSQDVGFDLLQTGFDIEGVLGSSSVVSGACATLLSLDQSTGERFPSPITGTLNGTDLAINILSMRLLSGVPNQVTAVLAAGTLDDGELTATGTLFGPRTWTDFDHDFLPDCDLANPAAQGECGAVGGASRAITLAAQLVLGWPQLTGLMLTKPTIAGCLPVTGTVILSSPAPAGGLVMSLSESLTAAGVPATLKIAAGAASKNFKVTTTPVVAAEAGTVSATFGAITLTAPLTVRPMSVMSISLTPSPVVGGNPVSGTVKLECKAEPAILVELGSSNPAVADPTVPNVLVPAGSQTAPFTVNTSGVAKKTTVEITAEANGLATTKKLKVTP